MGPDTLFANFGCIVTER